MTGVYQVLTISIQLAFQIKTLKATEQQQLMKNLQVHYEDFLEDSQESQVFSIADRLRLEEEVDGCKEHYEQLLATMETGQLKNPRNITYGLRLVSSA